MKKTPINYKKYRFKNKNQKLIALFSHSSLLEGAEKTLLNYTNLLLENEFLCYVFIPRNRILEEELKNCLPMETLGRVTTEAMSLKKPIISTRSEGTPDLIEDRRTRLLLSTRDFVNLTKKQSFFITIVKRFENTVVTLKSFTKKRFSNNKF